MLVPAVTSLLLLPGLLRSASAQQSTNSSSAPLASNATASSSSSPSSSVAPLAAAQTPGFVNNGTVGSYNCSASAGAPTAPSSQPSQAVLNGTQQPSATAEYRGGYGYASCPLGRKPNYPYDTVNLIAPDDSLRASFMPYGATLTEFWTKDRFGNWRDVVLGFDNTTNWGTDKIHPNFGPVVGRYANRIKNGTFTVDGQTYHAPLNENKLDTLHGGTVGYDRSPFKIAELNASSVTFELQDADGNQGFPGDVASRITYSLQEGAIWKIDMEANATTKRTPLMLSSHVYWNLEAYNETQSVLGHYVHMPAVDKYVETDSILIPTGNLPSVQGTGFDFRQARTLDSLFNLTDGYCGAGCKGWDNCFVQSQPPPRQTPVLEMWSPLSGIKLSVTTDQPAIQLYTCDGISKPNKQLPRKRSHGGDGTLNVFYDNHSCAVIEMEDYIDGINHPEWGRDQIYGPGRPYKWTAEYAFSVVDGTNSTTSPTGGPATNSNTTAASA